jgi:hypothetical protein
LKVARRHLACAADGDPLRTDIRPPQPPGRCPVRALEPLRGEARAAMAPRLTTVEDAIAPGGDQQRELAEQLLSQAKYQKLIPCKSRRDHRNRLACNRELATESP